MNRLYFRINEQIRTDRIRLIDETGDQVGIKTVQEGLALARQKGLDLVEMVPNAKPPVCKIVNYSKFRYEQEKKYKEEHKRTKIGLIKQIDFRPRINQHDLDFKINHAREFLEKKQKVRIVIVFFGREIQHSEFGRDLMNKIKERIADISVIEQEPRLDGNRITGLFAPKKVS